MLPECCPCVIPIVIPSFRLVSRMWPYLSKCYLYVVCMLLLSFSYVPACIRALPVCYPYVSRIYLCGVLVKIPVNGYRDSEEIKKITHVILLSFTTIYFLFFFKRKKTELALFREKKRGGINCQLIRLRY